MCKAIWKVLVLGILLFLIFCVSCGKQENATEYDSIEMNEGESYSMDVQNHTFEKVNDSFFEQADVDAGDEQLGNELYGDDITFSGIQEYFGLESVKVGDRYEYICEDGHIICGTCVPQGNYMLNEHLQRLDYIRVDFLESPPAEQFRVYDSGKSGEERILLISAHSLCITDVNGDCLAEFTFGDRAIDIMLMMAILFRPEQLDEYVSHLGECSYICAENQALETWKGYCFDADGDGSNENIFVAYCGEPWHSEWSLSNPHMAQGDYVTGVYIYVNGVLCVANQYSFAPLTSHVGLVILPEDDSHLYLTAYESGGELTATTFYRFEDDSVTFAFTSGTDVFTYAPVSYEHAIIKKVTGINASVLDDIR